MISKGALSRSVFSVGATHSPSCILTSQKCVSVKRSFRPFCHAWWRVLWNSKTLLIPILDPLRGICSPALLSPGCNSHREPPYRSWRCSSPFQFYLDSLLFANIDTHCFHHRLCGRKVRAGDKYFLRYAEWQMCPLLAKASHSGNPTHFERAKLPFTEAEDPRSNKTKILSLQTDCSSPQAKLFPGTFIYLSYL